MNIVFWQNILSPHQSAFMRALAGRGHDVTVIAHERMSPQRRQLGWESPDLGQASVKVGMSLSDARRFIRESPDDAIHCIGGARVSTFGKCVADECRVARRRMGIISETADPRGPAGLLRWGKYLSERLTVGWSFDFVLAMGEIGVRWFRICGYPAARVFPFCYVTETVDRAAMAHTAGPSRFLYVGQLIHRKGIDLLLRALARSPDIELDVIGDGALRSSLERLADRLRIALRVHWLGKMDFAGIQPRMASATALVLPSRLDGWGAVVNEALTLGTPVICSDACGSHDLIRHAWLGTVYPAGDVAALHRGLEHWSSRSSRIALERDRIRAWAECISGDSVALYLENVLRHVYEHGARPAAPWRPQG